MSFEFLAVDAASRAGRYTPVAHSPMEAQARDAGARFELRDGWSVAVAYGDGDDERRAIETTGAWTDSSALGKIELQAAPAELAGIIAGAGGEHGELGLATRAAGAWWCPLTPDRALAICEPSRTPAGQVTSARFSPQLEKVIGLAWVPAALASDGAAITISDGGTTLQAQIVTQPFYDPAGEVLRS